MLREEREQKCADRAGDAVREPNHYTRLKIQPVDYITANGFDFLTGNIIKYASRAGHKGDAVEDLKKVIRCAQMKINVLEGRNGTSDL